MAQLRLALLLVPAMAIADTTPMVKPPASWRADAERAAAVARAGQGAVEVYVGDGAELVVTRTAVADVRAAIDDFHGMVARAKLTSTSVVETAWEDTGTAATLAWHDANVAETARLVAAASPSARETVVVTGECIASADAALAPCKAALATLDPGTAVPVMAPAAPTQPSEPSRMSQGSDVHLPPIDLTEGGSSIDRRPMYVGAFLVVMAGLLWWSRRKRDRFGDDEDASDLRDAAKGPDHE